MAADSIKAVERALKNGFTEKGEEVVVRAYKSDYKDFIRMYVISDYFKGKSEKERLGAVHSTLESHGAKGLFSRISLCIAMTKREYDKEFGGDIWLGVIDNVDRGAKPRPRSHRLAKAHGRN